GRFYSYKSLLTPIRTRRSNGDDSKKTVNRFLLTKALSKKSLCVEITSDPTLPTVSNLSISTIEGTDSTTFDLDVTSEAPSSLQITLNSNGYTSGTATLDGTTVTLTHSRHRQTGGTITYSASDSNGTSSVATVTISPQSTSADFAGDPDSLEPYRDGVLTLEERKHLLSRATFGPTQELLDQAATMPLDSLVDYLLTDMRTNGVFDQARAYADFFKDSTTFEYDLDNNPNTGLQGRESRYRLNFQNDGQFSFEALFYQLMRHGDTHAKLMYILHSTLNPTLLEAFQGRAAGFAMTKYIDGLTSYSMGSYEDFCKSWDDGPVTFSLDNHTNSAAAPNENYGRELLELFTMGARNQAGIDNYDQQNVVQITRGVSGYQLVYGVGTRSALFPLSIELPNYPGSASSPSQLFIEWNLYTQSFSSVNRWSDPGAPTFGEQDAERPFVGTSSEWSGNPIDLDHAEICNFLLYHVNVTNGVSESARYHARKLLAKFVDPAVAPELVEPVAQILMDTRFSYREATRAILKSSAMFSDAVKSSGYISGLDVFMRVIRALDLTLTNNPGEQIMVYRLGQSASRVNHDIKAPPSVFGFNELGDNRGADINRGEAAYAEAVYLGRYGELSYLLDLFEENKEIRGENWNNVLPKLRPEARETVVHLSNLLGVTLTPAQIAILESYATTFRGSSGGGDDIVRTWGSFSNANFEDVVRMKVPGIVQMILFTSGYAF
ncbi:MAG: DUF1800 family protein, partial [Bdellovibrionales bacterium]|nr:DUF1800 family protein [Bdellovibrionales bacterium]